MAPQIKTRKLPVIISASAMNKTLEWRDLVKSTIINSGDSRVRALSPALVLALIYTESRGNPNAISPEGSSYGLMQVNYRLHYAGRPKGELLNPQVNVIEGTKIISGMIANLGGNTEAAISAYNGGGGKKYPPGTRFCLMWDEDAPTTNRNLDRDCALMYVTTEPTGEYGNQPYVDEVLAAQRDIIARGFGGSGSTGPVIPVPSTPTPGTAGFGGKGVAVVGGAIGVYAVLRLLRLVD